MHRSSRSRSPARDLVHVQMEQLPDGGGAARRLQRGHTSHFVPFLTSQQAQAQLLIPFLISTLLRTSVFKSLKEKLKSNDSNMMYAPIGKGFYSRLRDMQKLMYDQMDGYTSRILNEMIDLAENNRLFIGVEKKWDDAHRYITYEPSLYLDITASRSESPERL